MKKSLKVTVTVKTDYVIHDSARVNQIMGNVASILTSHYTKGKTK